jgi:OPA family glycerol-3-phosphate transporter-like MFS transporter 1/2
MARLVASRGGKNLTAHQYRFSVLVITFLSYMMYHASRKPPSIVKSVLNPTDEQRRAGIPGWEPFNGPDGNQLLGQTDVAFLAAYSIGMFFSGHLGDSMDLRIFLTYGMVGSGLFVCMFGFGQSWEQHNMWFYVFVQILAGVFQSTGWPSVVSVMGNWFGKSKRGLIMGVWNAHTSVGNIIGSLLSAQMLRRGDWGNAFIVNGVLTILCGWLVYGFLVVNPEDAGHPSPHGAANESSGDLSVLGKSPSALSVEDAALLNDDLKNSTVRSIGHAHPVSPKQRNAPRAAGFRAALKIPGVITFSLCLFFTKLVAYTFLYWLPFYIERTEIGGAYLSPAEAGRLSTLFDIGGVAGGILAGYISDRYNARSLTSAGFVYLSIPVLYCYREYGNSSMLANASLMMVAGMLVNGPYALITTAVSADLGTHESLKGNARALATVTAIIDGTGSIGAAVGPMLTGWISSHTDDWNNVFFMLYAADLIAGLLLMKLVMKEIRAMPNAFTS